MSAPVPTATPADRLYSKSAVIQDFIALGAGRYVAYALSFAMSIAQKAVLGPYVVGVWQLLSIVRMYLSYGDIGVGRGAEQRLPALAATDLPEEEACKDAAYTAVLSSVGVVNLLVLLGTFVWPWPVDALVLWGVRAMTVIVFIEALSNMMELSALRARARFRLLGIQVFVSEAIFALASVPAALVAGLWGLFAALFVSLAFKPIYMRLVTGERFRVRWDRPRTLALLQIGFPLTIFTVLYKTFDVVDRFLLLRGGDVQSLGYYSIATMTMVFLGNFPLIISIVLFPRTMSGFELRSRDQLAAYFQQAQFCILFAAGVAGGACYFVMPVVVAYALPTFALGIPALKISVFSSMFAGITQLPIQYLTAANRQWTLVCIMAVATAAYYAVGLAAVPWLGHSPAWLACIASARVASYAALAIVLIAWVMRSETGPSGRWFREMGGLALYLAGLPVTIDFVLGGQADASLARSVVRTTLQLSLYCLALVPTVYFLQRRTGVVSAIAQCWRQLRGAGDAS